MAVRTENREAERGEISRAERSVDMRGIGERRSRRSAYIDSICRNLLWLPISIVLLILFTEIVFRIAHAGEEDFLKVDPLLGYVHLENKLVTFRSEGFSQDKINRIGLRDFDYPLIKPKGTFRIAVLGDSLTEAFQVPLKDTFVKLLEKKLNKNKIPGKTDGKEKMRYEVINFGMSGFSTGQEYMNFRLQAAQYHPDITLVMYHTQDTEETVLPAFDPNPVPRPYFFLDTKHALQVDWGAIQHWLKSDRAHFMQATNFIRRNSRILGVLLSLDVALHSDPFFKKIEPIVTRIFAPLLSQLIKKMTSDSLALNRFDPSLIKTNLDGKPYYLPYKDHFGSGIFKMSASSLEAVQAQAILRNHQLQWHVMQALFHQLKQECDSVHSRLVVACLPAPSNSFLYFRELGHLQEQAKHDGFTFINIHKEFPPLKLMDKNPLFYRQHLSLQGHRRVANVLYCRLLDQNLVY